MSELKHIALQAIETDSPSTYFNSNAQPLGVSESSEYLQLRAVLAHHEGNIKLLQEAVDEIAAVAENVSESELVTYEEESKRDWKRMLQDANKELGLATPVPAVVGANTFFAVPNIERVSSTLKERARQRVQNDCKQQKSVFLKTITAACVAPRAVRVIQDAILQEMQRRVQTDIESILHI